MKAELVFRSQHKHTRAGSKSASENANEEKADGTRKEGLFQTWFCQGHFRFFDISIFRYFDLMFGQRR